MRNSYGQTEGQPAHCFRVAPESCHHLELEVVAIVALSKYGEVCTVGHDQDVAHSYVNDRVSVRATMGGDYRRKAEDCRVWPGKDWPFENPTTGASFADVHKTKLVTTNLQYGSVTDRCWGGVVV